ncbi:MAG: hypothetical protein JEY94_18675 [Melioribacteraceae bacterium]|nr:hypothetical protein [Melioribacteraceae bacterium]
MRIGTNAVGNYSPYGISSTKPVVKSEQTANIQESNKVDNKNKISQEEKKYFAKLYPQNKNEIIDYHFYQNSGKMGGVSVGSLFDRRG